ncbi:hypothetical protein L2E82_32618 [Cichorium intybus]|uniref:Uncharacterized protein n=1 Tax=Cichorium intybus TaxID=13427 RepID=A0ACB9BHP7_CICIN|nr:hypothetical protein L2E82_32618 [Cichorium intybus]
MIFSNKDSISESSSFRDNFPLDHSSLSLFLRCTAPEESRDTICLSKKRFDGVCYCDIVAFNTIVLDCCDWMLSFWKESCSQRSSNSSILRSSCTTIWSAGPTQ